jgi:hypothetical protein
VKGYAMTREDKPVFWLTVEIRHGPAYGHRMELHLDAPHWKDPVIKELGWWKGLGVPESVLNSARAIVDATLTEHLVTRYGIQGELPTRWGGEPDPF